MSLRRIVVVILLLNAAAFAGSLASRWPDWLAAVTESSPLTWFSSVQLVAIALVCAANLWLAQRLPAATSSQRRIQIAVWAVLAGGFGWFALDERFMLHEHVRDRFLLQRGLFVDVPGVGPGEVVLLSIAIAGACFGVIALRALAERTTRGLFIGAIAVSALAVLVDAVNLAGQPERVLHLSMVFEEALEMLGQAGFLASFVNHFMLRVEGALRAPVTRGGSISAS